MSRNPYAFPGRDLHRTRPVGWPYDVREQTFRKFVGPPTAVAPRRVPGADAYRSSSTGASLLRQRTMLAAAGLLAIGCAAPQAAPGPASAPGAAASATPASAPRVSGTDADGAEAPSVEGAGVGAASSGPRPASPEAWAPGDVVAAS